MAPDVVVVEIVGAGVDAFVVAVTGGVFGRVILGVSIGVIVTPDEGAG